MRTPGRSDSASNSNGALPHSIEAEQALLGSLLLSNDMLDRVPEHLAPEHFHEPLHGRIFEVINKRIRGGQGVSPITLTPHFESDEAMAEMGGPDYLVRLAGAAVSIRHARDYADTVYGLALRRMLVALGEDIQDTARDGANELNPQQQIREAERKLYALGERGKIESGFRQFSPLAVEAIERAVKAYKWEGEAYGLSTGLLDIDRKIGGLRESDLIIVAGRTAMGKSALAINIAFHAAKAGSPATRGDPEEGKPAGGVAYFSLEMSAIQLATRILSSQSRIPSQNISRGKLTEQEFQEFVRVSNELSELPLYIDDTAALDIDSLCSRARRLQRQRGLDVVFVDYLQLVESTLRREAREQRVAEVSRRLKALAKELNIPVVALAQLSRQVEARESKRPQLSDLRESGSIEQDADIVILIHREEYYVERDRPPERDQVKFVKWQDEMAKVHNLAELHIAKHRNGPTGNVDLFFDRHFTQFGDYRPGEDHELDNTGIREFG